MPTRIQSNLSIAEADGAAHELCLTLVTASGEEMSLADARLAIAQKHGFVTWRHLVVFLLQHSRAEVENAENRSLAFLQLACLNYSLDDCPSNWERARQLLSELPELATVDIFHASCVGDVAAVERFLDEDPSLIDQHGGYFGWQPLMYACYSRLDLAEYSTLRVARLLLERGADPNPYYMWGGQYKFTALTGVFGEGEAGPANSPEHAQCLPLARVLLEAGAQANDAQALYNRMFGGGNECLELLLEFGLNKEDRCNWLLDECDALAENPQQTLQYQLSWALRNNHPRRARLLIDRGADLSTPAGSTSFYEMAMLAGAPDIANYLVQCGAERLELDNVAKFACACMSGDEAAARKLLDAQADLMTQLQQQQPGLPNDAAAANRLKAMQLMIELGVDLDLKNRMAPLHEAAWNGHVEMVRLLTENGANLGVRDDVHTATPLQWALHNDQRAVAEYLSTQPIDIFDAIICDNPSRVTQLIDEDAPQLEVTLKEVVGNAAPRDDDWKTPLAVAASRGRVEIVRTLLERGANAKVANPQGQMLLEFIQPTASPEIIALLRQYEE